MIGRRTILGFGMFLVLAFSALAAQSATASLGTTAFTCKQLGGAGHQFSKAHCRPADDVGGEFAHIAIAEKTLTEVEVTNERTQGETSEARHSLFKETIGGVEVELNAAAVTGEGTMENKKDVSTGEHYAEGSATITYSGITVAKPAGKGCKLFTDETATKTQGSEGVVDAKVKLTTQGQGMFVKAEPKEGTAFATFFIECTITKVPAAEGTWEVTGSLKCPTDGATVLCSHTEVTTQNTLKGKGQKAGLDAAVTLNAVEEEACGPIYTPLSVTTTETP